MTLTSDVRDVLYASWIVPVGGDVGPLVPKGVKLFERNGRTILTVLTYRHGHFGPSLLGPLRALFPSPLQSNWRLYVAQFRGQPSSRLVLFVRNIFDSISYAIGSRLFSDILPSHASAAFEHMCSDSECETRIVDVDGGLSIRLVASRSDSAQLPREFGDFFSSWEEAVKFLALQEGAIAAVPDETALAHSRIDLPVEMGFVRPMDALAYEAGEWLRSLGAEAAPFCFAVPRVRFRALSDSLLR